MIDGGVKNPHEIVVGIGHDPFLLFVPEHRHRDPAAIMRVGLEVRFAQKFEAVNWIRSVARSFSECPAAIIADWVDNRHSNDFLKLFEAPDNDGAMSPGTSPRNVKMITSRNCRVSGTSVRCNPIPECVLLALKLARVTLFIRKLR